MEYFIIVYFFVWMCALCSQIKQLVEIKEKNNGK